MLVSFYLELIFVLWQVTSDNNVDQLTNGRFLPFPASASILSRKIPRKIEPVNLNLEWQLVGLPVVNKKVIGQMFDRTDANFTLRQFSRQALLQHERMKKQKIEINTGGSSSKSSFTLDESDKPMETNFEAMTSIMNYVVLRLVFFVLSSFRYFMLYFVLFCSNWIDPCDKSPFSLLYVAWEMFMDHTLLPDTAEDVFAHFLHLKTNAVLTGKCFPSVQELKQALSLRLFALSQRKDDKKKRDAPKPKSGAKTTKTVTPKPTQVAQGARFCQEFNNSSCPRQAPEAAFCSLNNLTLIHACNKKVDGKSCGGKHTRRDCPK